MITATDISNLLEQKYSVDKFLSISECKIGSTHFKRMCSRFDMWVMARSWQNPRFIGLEIKVSRSDFLQDTKWPNYLPYCTELYFVSPPDIIDPAEVPEQAGLIITTKNCKRLITKKKAPVRSIEIPQSILVYILMCRTKIVSDTMAETNIELAQGWLKELEGKKKLGRTISRCIGKLAEKKVKEVMKTNRELRDENLRLQWIKECVEGFGISANDKQFGRYAVERKIKEAMDGIPFDLPEFLKQIERNARLALEALNR